MPNYVFDIPQVNTIYVPETTGTGVSVANIYPDNRTNFKLIRGIQNQPMFWVRDIDKRIVDMINQTLTIYIVDDVENTTLMQRNLTLVDASRALFQLTILASETVQWPDRVRYSLTRTPRDGQPLMLWLDLNYGPYGYCSVLDGPIPSAAPTVSLDPSTFVISNGTAVSPSFRGSGAYGDISGFQTISASLNDFTGVLTVEGSLTTSPQSDSDWFVCTTKTYAAQTGTVPLNIYGVVPILRVKISASGGGLDNIVYKNVLQINANTSS